MKLPDLGQGPIAHLHYWAINAPDMPALVSYRRRLSWLQLLAEVQSVVQLLRDFRLQGRTLLDFRLDTEIVFTLACLHEGIVCAGLPDRIDSKSLRKAGFENVLTVDGVPEISGLREIRVSTYAAMDKPKDNFSYHSFEDDEIMRVIFSSGSTGISKPIAFTKKAMEARIQKVSESYLSQTPFMSLAGVRSSLGNNAFLTSLWLGNPILVPSGVKQDLELIEEFSIRNIVASPSILQTHLQSGSAPIQSQLEVVHSAGAHLNQKLAARAVNFFDAEVVNLYGSTEAGIFAQKNALDGDQLLAGSLLDGATVEIFGPEGELLGPGVEGEIRVQTSFQASGYLGDPGAFSSLYKDGWFYPGDRGFLDSNGQLHVAGRTDDLLNLGGLKIDPLPIEQFALDNFEITDCACFLATKDDGTTVHVMLVVGEKALNIDTIRTRLVEKFGGSAPEAVLQNTKVPRNENGKIIRSARVNISRNNSISGADEI